MKLPWPTNFPEVVSNRTVGLLQKHPCFRAAKHGDPDAARTLVNNLADEKLIVAAGRRFGGARLLVVTSSNEGGNRIPMAYAQEFERYSGLPIELGVVKANTPCHTGNNAYYRFLHRASFTGTLRPGQNYVLLDDVSTQGGTLSELRQFVHQQGGRVIGVACLAHTPSKVMGNGRQLAPTIETLSAIDRKHGLVSVSKLLEELNIYEGEPYCLTESEALLILREPSLSAFHSELNRILCPEKEDVVVPTATVIRSRLLPR